MIPVDEARLRILATLAPTAAETVALSACFGRVTARPVLSRLTQPPADISAMDGYAVRTGDGSSFDVVGTSPAGHPWEGAVGPCQAVRLYTGSIVPDGADSVVIQENVTRDGDRISLTTQVALGANIRRKGQDFAVGDVLIPAGRRLTPRDVGLIAAGNHPWVAVHRRPRVAILATGDEIALPGEPIPPGGIVSSNAHALAAFVQRAGCEALVLPIAPDDRAAIAEAAAGAVGCDLLITTGGASVGDHDLVASGLAEAGLVLDFWKIAMRPGKPLMHGRLGALPLIGLPGNPVSALICALLFVGPALDRLSGLPGDPPRRAHARLGRDLPANDHRADHLRATLSVDDQGALVVTPAPRQDSGMLRTLARADAVILRAPHAKAAYIGDQVEILQMDGIG